MRERLERFMIGRYGQDPLNRILLIAAMVLIVASMFWRPFYSLAFILMIITIFRMMSRNIGARQREYEFFAEKTREGKNLLFGTKTHKIFRCPRCHQQIRIPRGKGKIMITCPKCHQEFKKRT